MVKDRGDKVMSDLVSGDVRSRTVLLLGGAVAALLAGTLALWAYYGTAVFFEMLRAGWSACF
jgi:hypothetical protein